MIKKNNGGWDDEGENKRRGTSRKREMGRVNMKRLKKKERKKENR